MLQSLCYGTKLTLSEAAKRLECYRGLLYADPQPSPLEPPGDLSQLSEFHVSMSDFGKHVQFWFFGIRNLSFKRTEINDAFIALILQSFTMDMQILPYVWFYNHIVDHRDRHPSRKASQVNRGLCTKENAKSAKSALSFKPIWVIRIIFQALGN